VIYLGGNRLVPFGYSYIYMGVMIRNCLFFSCRSLCFVFVFNYKHIFIVNYECFC
jgi:hypothetical protein